MNNTIYHSYHVAGNENVAIAISEADPDDAHYFTRDPDVNDNAYVRALIWAYPGPDPEPEMSEDEKQEGVEGC